MNIFIYKQLQLLCFPFCGGRILGIGSHQLFLINFINIDHVKKSHKNTHKEEK